MKAEQYHNNFNGWLYVITMAFAFQNRIINTDDSNTMRMVICIGWILFAIFQMGYNSFKFKNKDEIVFFLKLYLIPHIIIHLYTIVIVSLGLTSWGYISSNISVYVPTLCAIMAVYLFRQNAAKYTLYAMILAWIISATISLIEFRPAIFAYAIQEAYFGITTPIGTVDTNYLEMHDLVLSLGYFIVFFIFAKSKITIKNLAALFAVILMMMLGLKRISIIAIIIAIAFNIMIKYLTLHKQYIFCKVAGWIGFAFCLLYVFVCSEHPEIIDMLVAAGVSMQGRSYYYAAIMQYAAFSPSFIGLGRNAVVNLLQNQFAYLNVGGVHSDIIKMYVENGFVLFVLWLWYYLRYVISKYKNRYGDKAAVLCFGITIYTFAMYLTDNTETYCMAQMVSIILPMTYAMYGVTFGKRLLAQKTNVEPPEVKNVN